MKKKKWLAAAILGCSLLLGGCGAADTAYQSGIEALQDKQYSKAEKYFQKAISQNDERAEYYIAYGMNLNGMQQYEDAIAQFENAYQDTENTIANANNKQVYYGEAISYYYLQEYEKSLELCEKALQLAQPNTLDSEIWCSKGAVLEGLQRREEAIQAYQEATKKDDENWQAYYRLSAIYTAQGEDDAAAQAAEFLVNAYENGMKENAYFLGMLSAEAGESKQAQTYLAEYVTIDAGEHLAEAYERLAEISLQDGEFSQAQTYLTKGRELAEGSAQQSLWRTQVILLERQGEFHEALSMVEEYLQQYPDDREMKREKRFLKTRDTQEQTTESEDANGKGI